MNNLISFLGRDRADPRTGYRKANFQFDAGFSHSEAFFGLALTEYLQQTEDLKPDRLLLVGTAGSMWNVFFKRQGVNDDEVLELMSAVDVKDERKKLQLTALRAS